MVSAALRVSAVLLCTVVAVVPARVLTTTSTDDQPLLSARHYQHTNRALGTQLVCDKCPAGTYVSVHCSPTAVRECSPCPKGTFTRGENGVQQCHHCQAPCPVGLIEKKPCTSTQDRVCTCPPNSFLSRDGVPQCVPHSRCPPGTRVKKRGSETEDTLCKPCTKGTFSDVESMTMRCQIHSNCQARGMVLLTPGTRETDNVCGHPITTLPSLFSPLDSKQATFVQESMNTSIPPLLTENKAIQLRETAHREDDKSDELLLGLSSALRHGLPRTPLTTAHIQSKQGVNKHAMESLQGPEVVRVGAGINIVVNQGSGIGDSTYYRPNRRGSPRPSTHEHFDINEHLPWMIVLLLLLVLVVIVVCSVKRSSRVLKKGPVQDPSSIMENSIQKKPSAPLTQVREKWIYYSNGQGVDILKLVAAQVGAQWIDIYQSLANATEREVAAFANGYSSDHERAYAALQHWTIRDSDANLAKVINALHRQRRTDVVEKLRCVMEDKPQFDINQLMTLVNVSQSLSPVHKLLESPSSTGSISGSIRQASGVCTALSPVDRTKGFFFDESEPLLRCDSTSSKESALSRNGSFITKEKKDTVLRQVRLDPCDLQPVFDDMLHILNPEELHVLEEIPAAEDRLDQLFEIAGVKSQEASQILLDSVYSHLPDLL
ncbi:tumor necrosis factor receptor superfamily member 21 [Nothobranchius furzeri]|uniref:TNF receptor superfamily member 21 n=1 Tax=Nothobranchius furzeri TaxID=105023 RepID=A0A1A8AZE7_NOTFU|nr:tumor necrosis factor receptor superfamily member 21 [Nothobranchius furzeri]KAF7231544.1 tumor necrosis factor receptor superfamily member 21 [Nothobranchius furzeri]